MNQDAAEQCIRGAKTAMAGGDWDKAIRMLDKAIRLNPDNAAEAHVLKMKATSGKASSSTAGKPVRPSPAPAPAAASPSKAYTPEQVQQVRAIRAAGKDYYKILGVPKGCDSGQLKKAYRKLAVKLHPDKCSAPGADEAFKAVGAAYACLSDPEQRQDYERFGADGPQVRQRRRGGGHHAHGDIDPEDIFNMFFGMQPQRGRTYHYQQPQQRQQQQHQRQGDAGNYAQLLQLMPLLLLFLFSFLGNQAGRNDLPFRLQRTPPEFTFRRETAASGTPYYVQANFDKLYGTRSKLQQVEREVDKHYLNNLMNECRREKVAQRQMMQESRWYMGNERKVRRKKAENMKMPACEELKDQGYDVGY